MSRDKPVTHVARQNTTISGRIRRPEGAERGEMVLALADDTLPGDRRHETERAPEARTERLGGSGQRGASSPRKRARWHVPAAVRFSRFTAWNSGNDDDTDGGGNSSTSATS